VQSMHGRDGKPPGESDGSEVTMIVDEVERTTLCRRLLDRSEDPHNMVCVRHPLLKGIVAALVPNRLDAPPDSVGCNGPAPANTVTSCPRRINPSAIRLTAVPTASHPPGGIATDGEASIAIR
jgi:hypothetical protein